MYAPERRQTSDGARGIESSPPSSHSYAAEEARQRSNSHTSLPPSPHYHQHQRSVPTSPTATRLPPPPPLPLSPTATRERSGSGYYDPTSDARTHSREHSLMSNPYPPSHREPVYNRYEPAVERPSELLVKPNAPGMPSYTDAREWHPNHGHPPPPTDARSPPRPHDAPRENGTHSHSNSEDFSQPPKRTSNPMAMNNLLSDAPTAAPLPPPPLAPKLASPPSAPFAPQPPLAPPPNKPSSRKSSRAASTSNTQQPADTMLVEASLSRQPHSNATAPPPQALPVPDPREPLPQSGPPSLTIRDTEAAYAEIQGRKLSDVEVELPEFDEVKAEYQGRSHKRMLELEVTESMKRKKRRMEVIRKYNTHFESAAESERQAFLEAHENEVAEEVRMKEVEEDKERKKDQQRKRRREKAIADEEQKRELDLQQLAVADDDEEKARLENAIMRRDKKIRDTKSRLQGIDPVKEKQENAANAAAIGRREREVALEGGYMTSFYSNGADHPDEATPEFTAGKGRAGKGRGGAGGRARKSKEQKQAEKDSAARAQAFLDQGQELPLIAPKEEERLQGYASRRFQDREDSEPLSDGHGFDMQPTAGLTGMARFESKGYNQIYEQITRQHAKDIAKVVRIKNSSIDTKQSNSRKTAQLAAKEARRWQLRTNKSTKDVAARAKRAMREMLGFWKRNERDEREGRKAAEKHELDKARKAEAEREANRQRRKLNFLISQTELYSHFIGKKVKTDEIEKSGVDQDGVAPTAETVVDGPGVKAIQFPDPSGKLKNKVTNFEDLDFDAEDETALQEAAMANAQNAIKEAQDRARAFNNDREEDMIEGAQDMDEGEMNFQNPSSLQNMDVAQPKMLECQLKEYQLKGLNWLVNLYEQGINGILADEMGLGKTVQSISVMAYLAEVHDIWGPFLVIAPASTLHNWQQEITRFVPDIKVLPYWGSAKDRKILRKFWDRKHITYNRESPFHVLVTSYQLVVQDTAYFQKVKWQYMILDEAQAIKSAQSARWKSLLGFHCRNRLLLTGTPIQNNMQELWALLHFIMPSLFDSHDEFSEWFSKDIENHAQSNTKLNEDQLRRLHMILKPFMLRRIKKHVQKELGDKIEEDVFCDLTYRQRAYYTNLRNKISINDLIEKAAIGDDQDAATLMNLIMQFRKVCNHPDLFERAEIWSPMSMSSFAETASFMREGHFVQVEYSVRSMIEYWLPSMLGSDGGRLDVAGPANDKAGWRKKWFATNFSIWDERHIHQSERQNGAFSWLRFIDQSAGGVAAIARKTLFERALDSPTDDGALAKLNVAYDDEDEKENAGFPPVHAMLNIVKRNDRKALAEVTNDGYLGKLMNISQTTMQEKGYSVIESCYFPPASAPPVELVCPADKSLVEKETSFFNVPIRRAMYPISMNTEYALLNAKTPLSRYPKTNLLPAPESQKQRFTNIQVPSMRRFVTDSGKLAHLDQLLRRLKEGNHRVLLYFQMTRMIDLMEEYLTYRNYKYCRLDGSTKLEDRRDTVAAFQSSPDIFVFLLSTRAGGLGINLTSADTVIFYDSDWNPTIDSQAMDRAHRLGQTRQVTVYRLITRGTIEERIRKRALQKEEVQRVVISGQAGGEKVVDFNNRSRETNRAKEMAMWLADDDQAAAIERREAEVMEEEAKSGGGNKKKRKVGGASGGGKRKEVSMDDMYHEGEGKFEDASHEASGAATPMSAFDPAGGPPMKKRKGLSKKAKTVRQRLAVVDGEVG